VLLFTRAISNEISVQKDIVMKRFVCNINVLWFATLPFILSSCVAQQPAFSQAEVRARELVRQMSLNEKIEQLHGFRDKTHFRVVPGLRRLGIPELLVTNGPAGVGPGGAGTQKKATALPAPIALAASWDTKLAYQYGKLAGEETIALGYNLLEAPDINIARVPQGGRVFESYGEDPLLASQIAVANLRGIQSTRVIGNVKHFAANNQETNRGSINEIIGERALHEIYLPAFEASIREGHSASIMCAYPRVNSAYNCENKPLLRDVLRKQWGFDGFVTSDFGAVHSTVSSIEAGLDLELPTGIYFGDAVRRALNEKEITEAQIDTMIVHRLTKMIEFGWLDHPLASESISAFEHGAISRQIAAQSMVLLKNEGNLLPLKRDKINRIALLGPYAVRTLSGGGGSSHVLPLYTVQPVDGIDGALEQQTQIDVLDGYDLDAATKAARRATIAIVMVGDDEGEDHDHGIVLSEVQNKLVEAVAAVNPHTIVVLKSGSAVLMPWIDKVAAVLEAWYPGEEDGNAVADVLFGHVNPSGKLPLTFPARAEDTLANHPDQFPGDGVTVRYSEGLEVGYRAYQAHHVQPLFPFGFGLSYTTFAMNNLHVEHQSDGVKVFFRVTNTGQREGAEVAQLYLTFPPIAEGNEPQHQLRGFAKVHLESGESQQIELALHPQDLRWWSEKTHSWQQTKGKFTIAVGDSSANTPLEARFIMP
jgi:beta-glucosidase